MRAERHATSRRSLARFRSPRSAISYTYKIGTIGGRSNISAVKAPVGGSSKSVVLITTDFSVAIVSAFGFLFIRQSIAELRVLL